MRTLILCALVLNLEAQQVDLSSLDKLATKAKESSNVTLDAEKLKMVSGFLSDTDGKQKKAQELISGLKGVFVRTFEFEKPGAWTPADLDPVRKQLRAPGWSRVIEVKEQGESTEVYMYKAGQETALAVIAAEKTELTVVNLVGPLDLKTLGQLGGSFGIPNIQSAFGGSDGKASTPPRTSTGAKDAREE